MSDQFVILRCDERIAPRPVPLEQVQDDIVERIKDEKLRTAAHELFASLQTTATIQNVYNDPQLRETMPDVVATVNGDRITHAGARQRVPAAARRGGAGSRKSRNCCSRRNFKSRMLTVEQADLDAEMQHAAELAGVVDEQGNADLKKWVETVTKEQEVTEAQYLRDSVWPSAALKKLTAQAVEVYRRRHSQGL